jgi:hypothetical protein
MHDVWSRGGELVGSAGARLRGGRTCHRGVGALVRVLTVRDTRSWADVDGLVAPGPNRRQVVLCSGPGPASVRNFNDFHSPKH